MRITNNSNMPEEIFEFLKYDDYDHTPDPKALSSTTIIKPIQEVVLNLRHGKDLEVDAMTRFFIVQGSAIHKVLESIKLEGAVKELRMIAELDGYKITGKPDLIHKNMVKDYKTASVFKIIFSNYKDWTAQLSIYRWLYYKVKNIELSTTGRAIYMLKDWTLKKKIVALTRRRKYPEHPMWYINLNLWSFEDTELYLKERIKAIKEALLVKDEDLPLCNSDERWCDKRTGENNKCEYYCSLKNYCQQYKNSKGG